MVDFREHERRKDAHAGLPLDRASRCVVGRLLVIEECEEPACVDQDQSSPKPRIASSQSVIGSPEKRGKRGRGGSWLRVYSSSAARIAAASLMPFRRAISPIRSLSSSGRYTVVFTISKSTIYIPYVFADAIGRCAPLDGHICCN